MWFFLQVSPAISFGGVPLVGRSFSGRKPAASHAIAPAGLLGAPTPRSGQHGLGDWALGAADDGATTEVRMPVLVWWRRSARQGVLAMPGVGVAYIRRRKAAQHIPTSRNPKSSSGGSRFSSVFEVNTTRLLRPVPRRKQHLCFEIVFRKHRPTSFAPPSK